MVITMRLDNPLMLFVHVFSSICSMTGTRIRLFRVTIWRKRESIWSKPRGQMSVTRDMNKSEMRSSKTSLLRLQICLNCYLLELTRDTDRVSHTGITTLDLSLLLTLLSKASETWERLRQLSKNLEPLMFQEESRKNIILLRSLLFWNSLKIISKKSLLHQSRKLGELFSTSFNQPWLVIIMIMSWQRKESKWFKHRGHLPRTLDMKLLETSCSKTSLLRHQKHYKCFRLEKFLIIQFFKLWINTGQLKNIRIIPLKLLALCQLPLRTFKT